MLSLEDLLNSWGLWKSSGEICCRAGGTYLQDKIQTGHKDSCPLIVNDHHQRMIDALIERHLTTRQKAVICVEYRSLPNIPYIKSTSDRAYYLRITDRAYRDRLNRAKSTLNAYLPYTD